jgi:hypothetical protein
MVDDTLTITIQADSGSYLDDVRLTEAGDTTLGSFLDALAAPCPLRSSWTSFGSTACGQQHQRQRGDDLHANGQFESNDEGSERTSDRVR